MSAVLDKTEELLRDLGDTRREVEHTLRENGFIEHASHTCLTCPVALYLQANLVSEIGPEVATRLEVSMGRVDYDIHLLAREPLQRKRTWYSPTPWSLEDPPPVPSPVLEFIEAWDDYKVRR